MRLRSPEELVEIGYSRSRVVMVNEAHSGFLRCVRTRRIGLRVLPAAHAAGVRWIAMEALTPGFAAEANATGDVPAWEGQGYLGQTDLRELIAAALELGWTLVDYECLGRPPKGDPMSTEAANWRDGEQARNLAGALGALSASARVLVWCGNGHLCKQRRRNWLPMAYRLIEIAGIEPFSIDQAVSVEFEAGHSGPWHELARRQRAELEAFGGTAGLLGADFPFERVGVDAVLLSTDNRLE